jgi:hypothetical protein
MNRRDKEKGYVWEKEKRLEEQKGNKINLKDRQCVECKKNIPSGTMTAIQMEFSIKNGAHCKECMEKKTRKFKPWLSRE